MNRQGWRRFALAAEAAAWLLGAWLALRLVPFRHVAGALRPRVGHPVPKGPERQKVIGQVCRTVRAVARRSPIPMVCFPRAIAAQRMLARRGVAATLPFGVGRNENGDLHAHVWVVVDRRTVLGNPTTGYTVVTTFDNASIKE